MCNTLKYWRGLILIIVLTSIRLPLAHAGISYSESPEAVVIKILGDIKVGDEQLISKYIALANTAFESSPRLIVYDLNSSGGDFLTAMKIGRLIRYAAFLPAIEVQAESSCLSSCVFVLAAGAYRHVSGAIGIHRPFFTNDKALNPTAQKKQYAQIEKMAKSYLEEMNISPLLYEDMMRVSPAQIKVLNNDDLERYGLNQNDHYVDSALNARVASRLKITTGEYIKRSQRANRECAGVTESEQGDCKAKIIAGKK